MSHCISTWLLY